MTSYSQPSGDSPDVFTSSRTITKPAGQPGVDVGLLAVGQGAAAVPLGRLVRIVGERTLAKKQQVPGRNQRPETERRF